MPPLSETPPSFFDSGHVWIQEYLDGALLRFQMDESGLLVFGDSNRIFDPDAHPPHFEEAIARIRADFDRDRFREGTNDPAAYTFFAVVPLGGRIDYDWNEMAPVLGVDIWNGETADFVAEDVLERVFDRLGLPILPVLEKERPVRDVDPDRFEMPESRWGDEAAAGVLFRKKHGVRTFVLREDFRAPSGGEYWYPERVSGADNNGAVDEGEPESVLETVITKARIDRPGGGSTPQVDPSHDFDASGIRDIVDSLCRDIARERYASFQSLLERDPSRFRHLVEERVRRVLTEEGP
jgi:hypothetical protein